MVFRATSRLSLSRRLFLLVPMSVATAGDEGRWEVISAVIGLKKGGGLGVEYRMTDIDGGDTETHNI